MDNKIHRCPFCAEVAELKTINPEGMPHIAYFTVQCQGCFVSTKSFDTATQALEAWNRRCVLEVSEPLAVGQYVYAVLPGLQEVIRLVTIKELRDGFIKVAWGGNSVFWIPQDEAIPTLWKVYINPDMVDKNEFQDNTAKRLPDKEEQQS